MELNSNAPSCTVKAAMYEHIGCKKDGAAINPKTGHPLKVKSIKDIIYSQLEIPSDIEKGHSGGVFPFEYDKMYSINDENIDFHSSGVVFQDLDHIPSNELQMIYNSFDFLVKRLPDLFCMHYSASGGGLHLYYLSPRFTPEEYTKRAILNYIRLSVVCSKFLGIEFPTNICDEHQVSIKQRFFLNRPKNMKILWFNNAVSPIFSEEQENALIDREIHRFPALEKKWKALQDVQQQATDVETVEFKSEFYDISRKDKKVEHLTYHDRWMLYNSLRVMFNNNQNLIDREWDWCMNNMIYTNQNNTQLKTALKEPRTKNWNSTVAHMAWTVVLKFYNIEPLKDTKCEDKPINVETNKEPALTEDEKLLLAKYM